jgi:hypothetical protein
MYNENYLILHAILLRGVNYDIIIRATEYVADK